jgi:hypothetical protein
MGHTTNRSISTPLRRWWRVSRYAIRFFAPRIGRLLVDLVTVPVFIFVALGWYGTFLDWQSTWKLSGWNMPTQFAALLAVVAVTSCTLTVLAVLFDWVHTSRRAILTSCACFFVAYLLMMLSVEARWTGHGFLTGLVGAGIGLGFQEVTSRLRPFKRDSWNGKSLRERWTSRQKRQKAS